MKSKLFLSLLISGLLIVAGCAKQTDASADCPNTKCQNGGTVTKTDTICGCSCGSGYTGDSCQFSSLGSYNALRVGNNSTTNVVVTFTTGASGLSITIPGATLQASYTAYNTFSVSTQTVGGVVYVGSGTFTPNNLSMSLTQGGVVYSYSGVHQ
ncbi:MAG: hypothetical protein KA149_09070 [Chitinophagales bacterium]|nr:hypothetical protein [Chitinophagales bacterium]